MAHVDRTTTPNSTVTHVETTKSSGSSALWLILGAALALALVYFIFVAGGVETAATGASDTTVVVTEGAGDAVEGAAAAVEGAASAVEGAVDSN